MKQWDTVAIVGVGLIGGSIGLALRQRGLARRVVGIGRRASSLAKARRCEAVTETTTNLARGVADAELVIVCTPVEQVISHVLDVAQHAADGALITDVASTKRQIVERLSALSLPRGVRFVGSHPLAGSEKSGPQHARADLFDDRIVVITPDDRSASDGNPSTGITARSNASRDDAVRKGAARNARTDRPSQGKGHPGTVKGLTSAVYETDRFWRSIGARTRIMPPDEHDRAVAAISHVPHIVAAALAEATPDEFLSLASTGWRDTTRVAGGDAELWRQILSDNRREVLAAMQLMQRQLDQFRAALKHNDQERILELLSAGKTKRDSVGS